MPGIGRDLVVNLAGNNSKLKSTIAESRGGLKSFAASAAGFLNPVTAGLTALAGGAIAAGAALYGLQGNISTLAGVADQAIQTGLNGAFIQRLGYAADQSGVSVETLTGGIKKLTIAIGKADAKPFEAIGISFAELQRMSPEQQFRKVVQQIGEIPTAAGRAAAAVKIFGKSGIEMTGLFADGVQGLNALLKDAEALGIGVSDEGLAKAARADDAIQRMKASFGALLDQVTVGLAPAFEYVATTIADMIPTVTKLFDKFNVIEEKMPFLAEVLVSGMDVGFEAIKLNWSTMFDDMLSKTVEFGKTVAKELSDPFVVFNGWRLDEFKASDQGKGLEAAKDRFRKLGEKINNADQQLPQWGGGKPPVDNNRGFAADTLENMRAERKRIASEGGSKLKGLFGGIADAAGPIIDGVKSKIRQEIESAKITGNWFKETAKNLIGDKIKDQKKAKEEKASTKPEPALAGAMQRGSSEAYSTIVQAMIRSKDPVVKATEKQTKQLVAALKSNPGQKFTFVPEFTA